MLAVDTFADGRTEAVVVDVVAGEGVIAGVAACKVSVRHWEKEEQMQWRHM